MKKLGKIMKEEHSGAVAFEYIIILVIMAVALFNGFVMLQETLESKADNIATFIDNNGQKTLSTSTHTKRTGSHN